MSNGLTSAPDEGGLRYFKVTHIGSGPPFSETPVSQPPVSQPPNTLFRLYVTPAALCFGRTGEAYFPEELGAAYDSLEPLAPEFLALHPQNFRLELASIQRLLLDRRPHLHNPLNGGSLHVWTGAEGTGLKPTHTTAMTFLLDYLTDADLLLDALAQACQAAGLPPPEVREDPALRIEHGAENAAQSGVNVLSCAPAPLTIHLQWQRGMGLLLLVFALGWSGLTTYLLAVLLAAFSLQPTFTNSAVIASLVVCLLAGLFLVYYALTHLFNTTHLVLHERTLRIRSAPLPWIARRRSLSLPPGAEILLHTRRLEHWSEYPSPSTYVYDLLAAVPGSPPLRLISLSRLPHALRVRQALRAALK